MRSIDTFRTAMACAGLALSVAGAFPALATLAYLRIEEKPLAPTERPKLLSVLRSNRALVARFVAPQLLISLGSGMTIPFLAVKEQYFSDSKMTYFLYRFCK